DVGRLAGFASEALENPRSRLWSRERLRFDDEVDRGPEPRAPRNALRRAGLVVALEAVVEEADAARVLATRARGDAVGEEPQRFGDPLDRESVRAREAVLATSGQTDVPAIVVVAIERELPDRTRHVARRLRPELGAELGK